jgi:hypothetical protein
VDDQRHHLLEGFADHGRRVRDHQDPGARRVHVQHLPLQVGGEDAGSDRAHDLVGQGHELLGAFGLLLEAVAGGAQGLAQEGDEQRHQHEADDVDHDL